MAPVTFEGRLFCIIFAIIGIPLTLTVIANLGKCMASVVNSAYKSCKKRCRQRVHLQETTTSKLRDFGGKFASVAATVLFVMFYISAGGYLFTLWESWTFFDSFYFCFVSHLLNPFMTIYFLSWEKFIKWGWFDEILKTILM